MSKNPAEFENRRRATNAKNYLRACRNCETEVMMCKNQHFCSTTCKGQWKYKNKDVTTETQYSKISGNWNRYLLRLCHRKNKDFVSRRALLNLLEKQDYKCALSGVQLTCQLEKGKNFMTNASIDRIQAGGPYTQDNIQLVCKAVNFWRNYLSVQEFVDWCQKVVNHNKPKHMI